MIFHIRGKVMVQPVVWGEQDSHKRKGGGAGEVVQSAVKSTGFSSRGPELNSQHPHGSLP